MQNSAGMTPFRLVSCAVAALAFLSVVTEAWSAWLQVLFNPWGNRTWPTFIDTFRTTLVFQAFMFLVVYALILTVTHLADARARIARQAERLSERAKARQSLGKNPCRTASSSAPWQDIISTMPVFHHN